MSADPINNLDEYEQVSSQMSDKQLSEMKIINRGHLGVPEEILKAGAAQYASMCGNINNKVFCLFILFIYSF